MGWIWAATARTGRDIVPSALGLAQSLSRAEGWSGGIENAHRECAFAAGRRLPKKSCPLNSRARPSGSPTHGAH